MIGIVYYLIVMVVSGIQSLITYIMTGIGTLLISRKLGLSGGWMGFVPILNGYQLGKIADEDRRRYHPEKEESNWRKWVIVSYVSMFALCVVVVITAVVAGLAMGFSAEESGELGAVGIVSLLLLVAAYLLLIGTAIFYSVVMYIIYYKVFHVMADSHAVWMLILCLFWGFAFPVLLLVLGVVKKFPLKEPASILCGEGEGEVVHTTFEEKPVEQTPAVEEPAAVEPAVEEPVAEAPVAEAPVTEEPAAEEPAAEEPAAEEPAAEEPAVEEPAAEEPAVEEPAAEAPVAEAPVTEELAVEEPAAEEPAVEEPAETTEE